MDIYAQFAQTYNTINIVIIIIGALLNVLFAAGVAKDVSLFTQNNITTRIVPGSVWVLATVIGGVWVAVAYWLIHHSSLFR